MKPSDLELPRGVTLVTVVVTLLAALVLPVAAFGLGYSALAASLATKAEVKGEFINQLISSAPDMWRFQEHRLRELLTRFPTEMEGERAHIVGLDGEVVASSDQQVDVPALTRSFVLFDAGRPIARVEVRASLRGVLLATGAAALFGLALAAGVFGLMRGLTARARRLVDAAFEEKERAQVTLHSIGDGVITTDRDERVQYLNPVAEALTGWTSAEAHGRPLDEVMRLIEEASRQPARTPMGEALGENRVASFSTEVALVRRDGSVLAVEDSAAPIHDRQGNVVGGVMVFHDVTIARAMAQRILWAAAHDALTGLVNRREFEVRVEAALSSARNSGKHHAMLYFDLDQFKVVNDTCGHAAGDALLQRLATLLQSKVRESDTLARLGGDEFGLLLDGCPRDRAELIAADLLAAVRDFRFQWDGKAFAVGASIGLVAINETTSSKAEVFSAADTACYAAKEQGRNRVCVFHGTDVDLAQRRRELGWAARLTQALEEDRFTLHYQSYMALADGAHGARHIEILLRLIGEDGELIQPGSFIPAAERYNVMPAIDRWVIRTAFARYHELAAELGSPLVCAINLSGSSLNSEGLFEYVRELAQQHALPPGAVCFEITETVAINNLRKAAQFMQRIKKLGFQFALDDFGTGTSSFGYLRNLPVDYLKIDGSFVRDIATDRIDKAMAETINRVGHIMGLKTIGEFAESDEVIGELRKLGVDFAQGYGVQRPQPLPAPRSSEPGPSADDVPTDPAALAAESAA